MKVKSTLAKNIEIADNEETSLDSACKKLLANKNILAWILKTCIEEYAESSLQEIERKYIEGIPRVAQDAVHRDEYVENGDYIQGGSSEDSSMTEGTVTYDIKFNALKPMRKSSMNSKGVASMIINVESQSDFYPGYPLSKRGIYYGSRMISAQYGTIFTKSHYEKLEKVYSIWVCLNPPKYRENSINIYSFHEKQLLGRAMEKKENYDLITVVMVCLGDEEDENCKGLLRLLSVLFSADKDINEKKEILETEFNIAMTKTMETEADEVGEFSKYFKEKGLREGRQEGIEQGIKQGVEQAIKNLMKNADMTLEQAMTVLEVSKKDRVMYAEKIEKG